MDSQILPAAFLLQGVALGFTAVTAPGPFQAFLISESLAGGWRRGAPVRSWLACCSYTFLMSL